jgi:hypothetical protein
LIDLIYALPLLGVTTAVSLGLALLIGAETATFVFRRKMTWILSSIRVICVFVFSVGTFGYLFSYLLTPFSNYQPLHTYLLSALLIVSEALKTVYLYRTRGK